LDDELSLKNVVNRALIFADTLYNEEYIVPNVRARGFDDKDLCFACSQSGHFPFDCNLLQGNTSEESSLKSTFLGLFEECF
jgi:hypothetical protein